MITRKDAIRLANEAGLMRLPNTDRALEVFAKLVEAETLLDIERKRLQTNRTKRNDPCSNIPTMG